MLLPLLLLYFPVIKEITRLLTGTEVDPTGKHNHVFVIVVILYFPHAYYCSTHHPFHWLEGKTIVPPCRYWFQQHELSFSFQEEMIHESISFIFGLDGSISHSPAKEKWSLSSFSSTSFTECLLGGERKRQILFCKTRNDRGLEEVNPNIKP